MKDWKSLSHVRWDCKYHVVFISKYRQRAIYGEVRSKIGGIIRDLCRQKGVELLEGHAMPDHIHLLLSIPPKFSVSNTVGFIKGKSSIRIHREILGTKRMTGLSFWATGYCVSGTISRKRGSEWVLEQKKKTNPLSSDRRRGLVNSQTVKRLKNYSIDFLTS